MDKLTLDITALETEALGELNHEAALVAKRRLTAKLRQIRDAEKIVANLKLEYEALKLELGAGA
jgi:hypothetical protein